MENIIQQITLELVEKINEKVFSKELTEVDKLAAGYVFPLVTAIEGTHSVGSRRNQAIEPRHFVDGE